MALIAILASIAMRSGMSLYREANLNVKLAGDRLAVESAVRHVVFDLQSINQAGIWLGANQDKNLEESGRTVFVQVQDVDGLVDLNEASVSEISALAQRLGINEPNEMAERIGAARPFRDYSSLMSKINLTDKDSMRFMHYVTLFSHRAIPVTEDAPLDVARPLDLGGAEIGQSQNPKDLIGHTVRIRAATGENASKSLTLSAEILITGKRNHPYYVYDWTWEPSVLSLLRRAEN